MSARYFLKRLAIEGFRGVNNEKDPLEITFRSDAVNSVFAVNGIGKSSVFEALCYAILGSIPKLDALQAQEKPQDYYCNRFHSKHSAVIELELEPDDGSVPIVVRIERDPTGARAVSSPTGHPDPQGLLAQLREAFALLDYRTFSRFIEESPLERGRTFSALLGLASYSDCRQALQSASDARAIGTDLEVKAIAAVISGKQSAALQALATLRHSFQKVIGTSLEDTAKLDVCTDQIASALGEVELLKPQCAGKKLADIDFDAIKATIRTEEGGDKRQELANLIQTIAALEGLTPLNDPAIADEQKQLETLVAERDALLATTQGDLFKRLLDSASELIAKGIWKDDAKCPLCDSKLDISLSKHVADQLAQYANASAKMKSLAEGWRSSKWKACLTAHEGEPALGVDLSDRKTTSLGTRCGAGDITKEALTEATAWTSSLVTRAAELLVAANLQKAALEKELPASLVQLTEQVEYGRQFKNALSEYRNAQSAEAAQQARLDIRERWRAFIAQATDLYADSEAALSKARIQGIEAEYKSMFAHIMNISDVVPELQRSDDREDLHVQLSDFHGQHKLSARALLSESYRNALAISVFLAAALKHSGAPRFVVLDDVTSSFDAGHQLLLMELLRTRLQHPVNANGLQFIVLSHDSLLEKYFDRLGSTASWQHSKLQGSPPMGAVLHQAQGADRLRKTITSLLSAGQVSQAEPLIRQYLEYKLQQIIRRVNIPVPIDFAIKDASRLVSNCLEAINSAIDLHRAAGTLVLNAQQILDLDGVHVPAIVGNWLAHYETGTSSSLGAPVLGGVIGSIDALAECFKYDQVLNGATTRKWYASLSQK